MRKLTIVIRVSLLAFLYLALLTSQLLAADNEATAKRLVEKLPADNQRPDYYTGQHHCTQWIR